MGLNMEDANTEPVDMGAEWEIRAAQGRQMAGKWAKIELVANFLGRYTWIVAGILSIAVVVYGKYVHSPRTIQDAQLILTFAGGLQILLGVYVGFWKRNYLNRLIDNEKEHPTVYVRVVMQSRAFVKLLEGLRNCDPCSLQQWRSDVDDLISNYEQAVMEQSSKKQRREWLSQKDIAEGLLSASYNTFYGTAMVLAAAALPLI